MTESGVPQRDPLTYDPDGVLARLRAALPESHADVDRIKAGILADGLSESLLQFVIEEYTWAVLGKRPKAAAPDMARWRRWVASSKASTAAMPTWTQRSGSGSSPACRN